MPDSPCLCIITPTIGRNSLINTLTSAETKPGDVWAVIGDGPTPAARAMAASAAAQQAGEVVYLETSIRLNRFGNPQRDLAMNQRYPVDYYIFLDDDDIFLPGALEVIRNTVTNVIEKTNPIMFRVENALGEVLWKDKRLSAGNIGGSMFVIPKTEGRLNYWDTQWGQAYISDYVFINGWLHQHGGFGRLRWSDEVIIKCRPDEGTVRNDR